MLPFPWQRISCFCPSLPELCHPAVILDILSKGAIWPKPPHLRPLLEKPLVNQHPCLVSCLESVILANGKRIWGRFRWQWQGRRGGWFHDVATRISVAQRITAHVPKAVKCHRIPRLRHDRIRLQEAGLAWISRPSPVLRILVTLRYHPSIIAR